MSRCDTGRFNPKPDGLFKGNGDQRMRPAKAANRIELRRFIVRDTTRRSGKFSDAMGAWFEASKIMARGWKATGANAGKLIVHVGSESR